MNTKHYTETQSELRTSPDNPGSCATVRGGGFVTQDMVGEILEQWRHRGPMPQQVLVDLREVAGYEQGCARLAHEFIEGAHREGVKQIACLASSTVLRTAAALVTSQAPISVRVFSDPGAAETWLGARAAR